MSDFLDAGRHFASPKFWLFEAEGEFFNTHSRFHSDPPVGRSVSEIAIYQ